jgi:hypothetical protein
MSDSLERVIRERLAQHRENLGLWESGYLAPTEPDPEERPATMGRIKVAIEVLEAALADAGISPNPPTASEVYNRPECIFNYCPTPTLCQPFGRCHAPANPAKTPDSTTLCDGCGVDRPNPGERFEGWRREATFNFCPLHRK